MNDEDKTKEQPLEELGKMRQRITELEALGAECVRLEEVLRESEEKYRHLFEDINDAAFLVDVETGRILETNLQGGVLLGRSRYEIVGMHYLELHPADKADEYRQTFTEHIERGHTTDFDAVVLGKDGKIVPVRVNASLLNIHGRRVSLALFRDITERKKAEEEIREFSFAVEQSIDGIAIGDLEPKLTYVNDAFARMHGYSPEEMMGMKVMNLHNEEQMDEYKKGINQIKTEGSWVGEIGHIRKDGTPFPTYMSVTLLKDRDEKPIGILAVARDISERKQMEKDLWKRTHDLGKRVKELNCLYAISQLVEKAGISLEEIFQGTVELITLAWQYPEITCARIILEGREFKTGNFRETIWKQASDIVVHGKLIGSVEVCLLEERPERNEELFLKEERSLLNAISGRLGRIIERKWAEETVRQSEAKYREIAYNIPGIVYQFLRKKDGSIFVLFVSECCQEILGLKPEEIIEDPSLVLSMVMPEDLERAKQEIARSMETMETSVLEFRMRTKAGETKWFHATANPHLLPDGSILWNGVVIDITERKQMEETLQEYRKAVESSQEMIAVLDCQYIYRLANEAFLRYRGLNRDQVIGHTVAELLGEDVFETKVKPSFDRCLGGENVRFEMVYRDPEGGNRDLQVSYYPLRGDEEEVTGVVAILRDVTLERKIERKRECLINLFQLLNKSVSLKETMREIVCLLKGCLGCDSVGIRLREGDDFPYLETQGFPEEFVRMENNLCTRDPDGQIIRDDTGNPVLECMCGSVISGRFNPAKPFFTESGSFWTNSTTELLASTPETDRQEWARNRCNGEGYESMALVPLRTEIETFGLLQLNHKCKGQFVPFDIAFLEMVGKYLGTWLARNRAEKALQDNERSYRLLAENVKDVIWTTDMNQRFTYISPSVTSLRGYTVEEAMAQTLEEVLTPASLEAARKALAEELAIEEMEQKDLTRSRTMQLEVKCKDAPTVWTESTMSFLRDRDGRAIGILGVTRDISERKKLEQEILKFSKLESVGILAGGIAHDFNNFLMVILGNISVAKMYTEPGDKIGERLTDAEKATLRAKDLTKQLLIFSKGGAPIKKIISIGELIKDATLFALRGSDVRCEFSIPTDLWPVEVDEGQISQVINNLIINADQAMPEGGIIEVCAENTTIEANYGLSLKEGEYVKISIKDQGVGIPEEHIPKIFDPYFTTKQKGSGLGLATTYSIIKNHQGYITLESKTGAGTTFYVYLPALSKEFLTKKEEEEKIFAGNGKILVVDDEKMVRDVTGNMLKLIGYEAEFARDGVEAIEVYKKARESQQSFDAIILDLTIPGAIGGTETIKKLIEIDPEVKAIVSSGYSNDLVMANFREYGFSGFLVKPYKIEELNEILQKIITGKNG